MYIKDWFFTVTLYIFTDCWNSYRNSTKVKKKLYVYSTLCQRGDFGGIFEMIEFWNPYENLIVRWKNSIENGENLSFPNVDFSLIFLKEFPLQNQVKLTFSTMEIFLILRSNFHMEIEIRFWWKYHQNHRTLLLSKLERIISLRTLENEV